jgi:hypothetical protein
MWGTRAFVSVRMCACVCVPIWERGGKGGGQRVKNHVKRSERAVHIMLKSGQHEQKITSEPWQITWSNRTNSLVPW